MSEYDRLLSKIDAFNDVLKEQKSHYTIYLFGSGLGIYHLKEDYRATQDLDYMSKEQISNQDTTMLLDMMDIHDMGGIMMVPELEDLKIVNEINYSNLTVKIPSIENFALSKLLSNRQKDYDDLKNYPILDNCNIKELKEMLDEYLPYFVFDDNPSYNFNFLDDLLEERELDKSEDSTPQQSYIDVSASHARDFSRELEHFFYLF